MKLGLGVDPSTTRTGLALCSLNDKGAMTIQQVWCVRTKRGLSGKSAIEYQSILLRDLFVRLRELKIRPIFTAIEMPEIYSGGKTRNPQSILGVAALAGACMAHSHMAWPEAIVGLVNPQRWKGSIPKRVMQARICKQLEWPFGKGSDYVYPLELPPVKGADQIRRADWSHVLDAVGLCGWRFSR